MTQRIAATLMTLGVAIVTVASALTLEGFHESGAAQQAAPAAAAPVPPPPPGVAVKKFTIEAKPAPVGATTVITQTVETKTVSVAPAGKAQEPPVRVLKAAPAPRPVATRRAAPAEEARVVAMNRRVRLANNGGQVVQFMQQFRPILRSEFHIVRVVCRPTPEQRKELARAGEKSLREAAVKYVEMMSRPMTPAQRAALDPRKQIREGLAKSVQKLLSAELAVRLDEESAKREASRKQLAVRNLVARLDKDLILSPDQRDKVAESLSAHWDDSWGQSLEMFMYDYQFLPPIPDQYVVNFLNDSQKKIWRSTQRVQTFWGGFGMMGGVMAEDPLEDEELRVARLEAARNEPEPAANQPGVMMLPAAPPQAIRVQAAPALRVIRKNTATPAGKTLTVEKAQPVEKAQVNTPAKTKTTTKTRKTNEAWK